MKRFEPLFGIKDKEVKENCLLMPFLPKGALDSFSVNELKKGKLYNCSNVEGLTIIQTGMGPGIVADAVLYLKATACRNIMLFGSCGLMHLKSNLGIGSIVCPSGSYSAESFSELICGKRQKLDFFCPDKQLFSDFINFSSDKPVSIVTCLTVSSLKTEEDRREDFVNMGIDVADMECSAFFAASIHAGIRSMALFYINDIVGKESFYNKPSAESKSRVISSIRECSVLISAFMRKNING